MVSSLLIPFSSKKILILLIQVLNPNLNVYPSFPETVLPGTQKDHSDLHRYVYHVEGPESVVPVERNVVR